MNIKTCKICDRELPESAFMRTKGGGLTGICRECRTAALRENKAAKRSQGGVKRLPFPTPTSTDVQSAMFGVRCAVRRSGLKAVGV